ncbi:MAG: adenylate/guanylate cyclase domain-containing protein, partial [Vulcanimicrobiaceae bacterium]
MKGAAIGELSFAAPADALTAINGRAVDVLLLDLMQSSGDVLKLLRAAAPTDEATAKTSVIVTAPATANDRIQSCLQYGAEDYIITPIDPKMPLLTTRRISLSLQRKHLSGFGLKVHSTATELDQTAILEVSNDVMMRFVPREFLDNLDKKSLTEVRLGDHVQRDMTVFFSDIRDFTSLSEKMTPQENFKFLNSYLKNVNPIIRAHKGFIDKYIGDAIMALFPNDPDDALLAGVNLQKAVFKYNQGRRLAGYVPISIGIGIHRGDLILGTIGEDERMQTTVIADAVNVASRLEGLTKTYRVGLLVSSTVVEGLQPTHPFKLRHLGGVKAKGKTQSVEIYECYNNDPAELIEHKDKTQDAFDSAMAEFRKGTFLTAGKIFGRIAELHPDDAPAAFFRDRCSLTVVHERGPGAWD